MSLWRRHVDAESVLLGFAVGGFFHLARAVLGRLGGSGIGQQAVAAIYTLDIPMIMGTVLFAATAIVVINLLVDLSYYWLDPRLRTH